LRAAADSGRLRKLERIVDLKIIIDTDPGIDDAMAIFYAHAAPDIELLGLTTVFGNVFAEQATRNALFLVDMIDADIPVVHGCDKPLNGQPVVSSTHVHGVEGFGNFTDIPERGASHEERAPEFLVRMAREHKGELVISAIAPLTNIAKAIQLDREFSKNVAKIVIMGGAVDCPGNITDHAEANIFHDPDAAEIVFSSDCEVVLVGLDVTLKTLCKVADFDRMAQEAPVTGGFLKTIGESYLEFYRNVARQEGCGLHDSTALIACTHPELFTMSDLGVDVVLTDDQLGNTVRSDLQDRSKIAVCLDVDAPRVNDLFLSRVCRNP